MKVAKIVLSLSVLVLAGFLLTGAHGRRRDTIRQPIQFNHYLHTTELELDCTSCHRYVEEAEFAGRPKTETCADCHEEALTENAEEAKLVRYVQSAEEVPWQRLYAVPAHVYYSHRRHVTVAKLECVVCHGEIGQSKAPPGEPLALLTMEFCIQCHEERGASTDCNACHR